MAISPKLIHSIRTNAHQSMILSLPPLTVVDDDIGPLCKAITFNTSITTLDLSRNSQLTFQGIKTLVEQLPTQIRKLWFFDCNLDACSIQLLKTLNLDELDIRNNRPSPEKEPSTPVPGFSILRFFHSFFSSPNQLQQNHVTSTSNHLPKPPG